ncbi:cysteine hydrolase, partial [Mesorhizobium sp. M00.F.Ca.ET.186.01.1.1]
DPYHPETGLYPPHNIIGTSGRNLYGSIQGIYEEFEDTIYWMDKTRYSAFQGTDLALQLRARGISEIHLVGVCTDICVLHTAIEGFYHGFRVVIHEDAVASFNPVGHEWALGHFQHQLGMAVVKK